jgi:hypothetical protein
MKLKRSNSSFQRPFLELIVELFTGLNRRISKFQLFSNLKRISIHDEKCSGDLTSQFVVRSPEFFTYIDTRSLKEKAVSHSQRNAYKCRNVFVDTRYGNVFSSDFELVVEATVWGEHFMHDYKWPIPKFAKKNIVENQKSAILMPSTPFYHFFVEDLPAFISLRALFPSAEILVWKHAPKYVFESLNNLECNFRIVDRFLELTDYIFVEKSKSLSPSQSDIEVVKSFIQKSRRWNNDSNDRKIYISRLGDSRSPKFERALIDKLSATGKWLILDMASKSLNEQITIMQSASVLAGVHGAGLSWVVAMPEGSRVVEIGPPQMDCFKQLASICKINYSQIQIPMKETDDGQFVFMELDSI